MSATAAQWVTPELAAPPAALSCTASAPDIHSMQELLALPHLMLPLPLAPMQLLLPGARPVAGAGRAAPLETDAQGWLPERPEGYIVSRRPRALLGEWPGALFAVELPAGHEPAAASALVPTCRLLHAVPAWHLFGPNGRAVVALIERAATLTGSEIVALRPPVNTIVAWYALRAPSDHWRRHDALEMAGQLAAAAAKEAIIDCASELIASGYRGHLEAMEAAQLAAQALVVRDLLGRDEFVRYYAPWQRVVDEPHLAI
jgi:hypothetical protein